MQFTLRIMGFSFFEILIYKATIQNLKRGAVLRLTLLL